MAVQGPSGRQPRLAVRPERIQPRAVVLLVALVGLSACQVVSGLSELEVSEAGSGGQASGGSSGSGGYTATGGDVTSCLVGWEQHSCRQGCGDPGDGVDVGCGNLMDCYLEEQCLPADCSDSLSDVCGGNKVENATPEALRMAREVVDCLCGP